MVNYGPNFVVANRTKVNYSLYTANIIINKLINKIKKQPLNYGFHDYFIRPKNALKFDLLLLSILVHSYEEGNTKKLEALTILLKILIGLF
jgi:galactose mutarotase-like enzyme